MNIQVNEVKQVVNSLLPNDQTRKICLGVFGEAIKYANLLGSDKWGAYYERRKVRLLVGSLVVFTIHSNCLWIALDQESLEASKESLDLLENTTSWQWDNYDYPRYTQVLSRNGFYTPSDNHEEVWSTIRKLHFNFIFKTAQKYKKLRKGTQHSTLLIEYIYNEIGDFLQVSTHQNVPPKGNQNLVKKYDEITRYSHDPDVVIWILNKANGVCESCNNNAPFSREDGTPFLEVHHLKMLADGGSDTITNVVAVCPNCHRELHYGVNREFRLQSIYSSVERLIAE